MPKKRKEAAPAEEKERGPIRSKKEALEAYKELLLRLLRLQELAARDLERELAWLERELKVAEE